MWNLGTVGTEDGGRRQVSWLGRKAQLWKAKDISRCKGQVDRELIDQGARLVSLVPQSLRWGWAVSQRHLSWQAVPRLQSPVAATLLGIMMTLFLFQSASAVMTHTLDSPGRDQASNLFYSLPSWGFRELQEKGGGGYALGSWTPAGAWPLKLSLLAVVVPCLGG